jgi:hypothetical protein
MNLTLVPSINVAVDSLRYSGSSQDVLSLSARVRSVQADVGDVAALMDQLQTRFPISQLESLFNRVALDWPWRERCPEIRLVEDSQQLLMVLKSIIVRAQLAVAAKPRTVDMWLRLAEVLFVMCKKYYAPVPHR